MSKVCGRCRKIKTLDPHIDPDSLCVCTGRVGKTRELTESDIDGVESILRSYGASKTVLNKVRDYLEAL